MKDLSLNTPAVGDRVSRAYLVALEELAGHTHAISEGMSSRHSVALIPPTSVTMKIYTCTLTANLLPGSYAAATLLVGAAKDETGDVISVKDIPTSITTGKMIASGVICRVWKDHDVDLDADEYVLLTIAGCEVAQ